MFEENISKISNKYLELGNTSQIWDTQPTISPLNILPSQAANQITQTVVLEHKLLQ